MSKNAVIYARVSTDEQAKGYSLKTQIEACEKYAFDKGYNVVSVFQDDYTGTTLDRPGLNQLCGFIEVNRVEVLIVYDIDRLARKSVYQAILEEELKHSGVIVEYVLGQFEDTDEGRLQKQIRVSIAEYEKGKIIERGKRGKRGKAQSGFVIVAARPPYGYKVKSEPHKSWLEVDEEEAAIVQLVFQTYARDDRPSIGKVARMLTEMGIPTRGDKVKHVAKKFGYAWWTGAMVRHILTNEAYIGRWYYGKTKMVDDGVHRESKQKRGTGKQIARDKAEWIPVEIPALIEPELFILIQERLKLNKEQATRNKKHDYLFSSRLTCSHCGYTFIGNTRRTGNAYYTCNGYRKFGRDFCIPVHFKTTRLEEIIWNWVYEIIQDPQAMAEGLIGIQDELKRENHTLFNRLEIIESQLEENERQLTRLMDLYLMGDFSPDILTERKNRLNESILKLRGERVIIQSHLASITITDEQLEEIEAFCAQIRTGLDMVTPEVKQQIIELLDVRGKMALENNEKVVYVKCLLGQQRLSVVATSPLSSIGATATPLFIFPPTALFP